jgi:hypothetical protein
MKIIPEACQSGQEQSNDSYKTENMGRSCSRSSKQMQVGAWATFSLMSSSLPVLQPPDHPEPHSNYEIPRHGSATIASVIEYLDATLWFSPFETLCSWW